MKILEHVNDIRKKVRETGKYAFVSKISGVNYHWLQKFSIGGIPNPTIGNIAKLEKFFDDQDANSDRAA